MYSLILTIFLVLINMSLIIMALSLISLALGKEKIAFIMMIGAIASTCLGLVLIAGALICALTLGLIF